MLNFELIGRSYDDEKPYTSYVNQLTHTKQAFYLQRTVFRKSEDFMTYIYKGGIGGGSSGGGSSNRNSWGIGFHQISERNIVSISLTMHAFGVVRPNCIIKYYH